MTLDPPPSRLRLSVPRRERLVEQRRWIDWTRCSLDRSRTVWDAFAINIRRRRWLSGDALLLDEMDGVSGSRMMVCTCFAWK